MTIIHMNLVNNGVKNLVIDYRYEELPPHQSQVENCPDA
jgi:hypothetical protein